MDSTVEKKEGIRVLLVGGGSGGHFYPLIAVGEEIKRLNPFASLYYAGPDEYDKDALTALGIHAITIPAGKLRRYSSLFNVLDPFVACIGFFVALIRLYVLYPDVIFSKGGFTSVPVVLAGAFLRIPIVVHESDAVAGRANKLASHFARHIFVTHPDSESLFPLRSVSRSGIPTRTVLLPNTARVKTLNIPTDRPVIFVIGGSQGALNINSLILDSLDELLKTYTVVHQTGKAHFTAITAGAEALIRSDEDKAHYLPTPFLDAEALGEMYQCASLIVTRAGSTSLFEIALHGKPSIIIPIPETISHDQRANAYSYARLGGGVVIEEHNLTDSLLRAEIDRIMQNEEIYTDMATKAQTFATEASSRTVSEFLLKTAQEH